MIIVTVSGRPVPCPRPRVTRRGTFYPARYTAWLELVGYEALAVRGDGRMLAGNLALSLWFTLPDRRRGDCDNYCKGLLDGLQGVLYENDRQITDLDAHLRIDPDQPGVTIMLREVVHIQSVDDALRAIGALEKDR